VTKLLLALCAVAMTVVSALAADVAGTWKVDGDVYGNPVKFVAALTQDGEKLSGTATFEGNKETPLTGSVKEKTVTFEFDSADKQYHLVFTGTIGDDGGMKGTIAVAGVEGVFTAVKQ
jgi:hypothetical protein